MAPALIVIAKAPVPGRVKTRLTRRARRSRPPRWRARRCRTRWTPRRARRAPAAASSSSTASPAPGCRDGFEVIAQRGDGLDERLAAAFADVGEPAFLVGMDTPQLTPGAARRRAWPRWPTATPPSAPRSTAATGRIGLRTPDPAVFAGVPMSTRAHRRRPARAAWRCSACTRAILPPLRDVDTFEDALAVAAEAPDTRFATELAALIAELQVAA